MATYNFPGVYSSVTDNSSFPTSVSRFRCAIVGTASKGVLNTPTLVSSVQDFRSTFGAPISGSYLADAAANTTKYSDSVYIVRIADTYKNIVTSKSLLQGPFTWTREGNILYVDDVTAPFTAQDAGEIWVRIYNGPVAVGDFAATYNNTKLEIDYADTATGGHSGADLTFYYLYEIIDTEIACQVTAGQYVQLSQPGKATTAGLKIVSTDVTTGRVKFIRAPITGETAVPGSIETGATKIAEAYEAATVAAADSADAAAPAEAMLSSCTWGSAITTFTAGGVLNGYELQLTPSTGLSMAEALAGANISAGTTLIQVSETGKATTYEALVKSMDATGRILLQTVSRADTGYQPVALAANYVAATVKVRTGYTAGAVHLRASSPGEWANTNTADTTGLTIKVLPGSTAGTKRMRVYENGNLVNDFDRLSADSTSAYYWPTQVNVTGSAVTVVNLPTEQPANTMIPWSRAAAVVNNPSFSGGQNGATVTADDYIGTSDGDDTVTGLQALTYPHDLPTLHVIACPGCTDMLVAREMANIAAEFNRVAIFDTPRGYNLREATAWHNSQLASSDSSSFSVLDTDYLGFYWNWILISDYFTGEQKYVPPSVGVIARMARNFDQYKPWFAHAGTTRGVLPEALGVEFPKVSQDALEACYGNGNCINPVLSLQGTITIWGNRTAKRSETKLSAINNVFLINECLNQLSAIARGYVFEPNDATLLSLLKTDFDNALTSIKNDRGMEDYSLIIDDSNNTAATRNNRSVYAALEVIPTDAAEKIYIGLSVNASGATLTSVS